jgi:Cu(I)/Ag(I) efflux system membrane fusion protein
MSLLKGDAHNKWTDILDKLNEALATINETTDIEKQRSAFSEISNNFYDAVREFGLTSETVYYQFCPMYKDNKGAYWLSESAI